LISGTLAAPSAAVLTRVAARLATDWRKLLPKLGFDKEVATTIEKEKADEVDRAVLLLEKWLATEKEAATSEELAFQLRKVGWTDEDTELALLEEKTVTELASSSEEVVASSPKKMKKEQ